MENLLAKENICDCGSIHNLNPLKILSPNFNDHELLKIMPIGIKVLFLSNNDNLKRKIMRYYRLVDVSDIGAQNLNLVDRDFDKQIEKIALQEDTRLIISEGEFIPFGKYLADKLSLKHIISGSGNLNSNDYIFDKVYKLKKLGSVDCIIKSEDNINLPSTFAFIFSTYLALFDWDISALLFGEQICSFIFLEVKKIVKTLLDSIKQLPKQSNRLKHLLIEANTNLAQIIESTESRLLFSGATQAAAALCLLFKYEERPLINFFDISFLFTPIIAKTYAAFLEMDQLFCFPPNNIKHINKMHEYLGISEALAFSLLKNKQKIDYKLIEYRLKIYKKELLSHIYDVIGVFDQAYPIYLRLYEDDGFFLKDFMSSLDISLSIGLGASVLKGNTLLSYMRDKGLLDRYII